MFDYPKWAEPLHHQIREKVERLAAEAVVEIGFIRKTFFSLLYLRSLLLALNRWYMDVISAVDNPTNAFLDLDRVSRAARKTSRSFSGFKLFSCRDLGLFRAIVEGRIIVSGFCNLYLQARLSLTERQITALLRHLRKQGLIKKIGGTIKYYLNAFGRRVITNGLKLREINLISMLRGMLQTTT